MRGQAGESVLTGGQGVGKTTGDRGKGWCATKDRDQSFRVLTEFERRSTVCRDCHEMKSVTLLLCLASKAQCSVEVHRVESGREKG